MHLDAQGRTRDKPWGLVTNRNLRWGEGHRAMELGHSILAGPARQGVHQYAVQISVSLSMSLVIASVISGMSDGRTAIQHALCTHDMLPRPYARYG